MPNTQNGLSANTILAAFIAFSLPILFAVAVAGPARRGNTSQAKFKAVPTKTTVDYKRQNKIARIMEQRQAELSIIKADITYNTRIVNRYKSRVRLGGDTAPTTQELQSISNIRRLTSRCNDLNREYQRENRNFGR